MSDPHEENPWIEARPATRAADLAIEECAPEVFRIPLEIPFEVGPVNAVLVRRPAPVLVDCGPGTKDAWRALEAGLRTLGVGPGGAPLAAVVLTHDHVDHYGNLGRLLAELAPGARVLVHEADASGVLDHAAHMLAKAPEIERRARWWGYPDVALEPARKGYMSFGRLATASIDRARVTVLEGETAEIDIEGARLRAIHTPGHSDGHICLALEGAGGLLLSGDHILERITPNPTVFYGLVRGRKSGLADYLASLRRVRDLAVARVVPGHGASFAGLAARVDTILGHHERRAAKVLSLLAGAPAPPTTLELALLLWPTMPLHEHFLACREVEGHLDLWIEAGRARAVAGTPALPWSAEAPPARFEAV